MTAYEAAERIAQLKPATLLDVGSGQGHQATFFRKHNIRVTTLDSHSDADRQGVWPDVNVGVYDCVWMAHVLEHMENAGAAIKKAMWSCNPGGIIAVTVPPMKPNLVGGHLSVWTPELLVYNLVKAGLDCSNAEVGVYKYNISVIVKKKMHDFEDWICDKGEIEKIAHLFPWDVTQGIAGCGNVNWFKQESPS